jgi:putative spermidine/putrescine transport system permease protein
LRIPRAWLVVLIGGPVAFLVAFFVLPFVLVLIESFQSETGAWTLAQYTKALGDAYYWDTLYLTFRISLWVTLVSFVVGYPLAYFIVRVVSNRAIRRLIYVIVVTPLFTSNIVRSFGWIVLLGRRGLVNQAIVGLGISETPLPLLYGEFSIVLGLSYIMLPLMVLTIASVLQNIDRSLEDAARDLGAGAWTAFAKVTFPLSLPGVIAGSLIVFTLSVSAYVTPSILSGGRQQVMPMLIFQQYGAVLNFPFGAALSVILLVTTLALVMAYVGVLSRTRRFA